MESMHDMEHSVAKKMMKKKPSIAQRTQMTRDAVAWFNKQTRKKK